MNWAVGGGDDVADGGPRHAPVQFAAAAGLNHHDCGAGTGTL